MQECMKQGTLEWLELRKTKITATDAPIIMGVSPWKTSLQLWKEKLDISESNFVNNAMKRGLELEEEARSCFEKHTGITVFPAVIISKKYPWMMASLDGIDIEGKEVVEIKCPGKADHDLALQGIVPEKYRPQLQHQMIVCNINYINYFSYTKESYVNIIVGKEEIYCIELLDKEKQFYDLLTNKIEPNKQQKDYIKRDDYEWNQISLEYLYIKKQLDFLAQKESKLREEIINLAGGSNTMGMGIKLSKVVKKGNVNYKSIPELEKIDLDKFRGQETEYWRIDIEE